MSFNNVIRFPQDGSNNRATRRFSPPCFYDSATFLTPNPIRDEPLMRTLTSKWFTNSTGMTVELCANYCNDNSFALAGLENGQDCCECTSLRCPQGVPSVS